MISLLIAIVGKDRIPPGIRYVFLAFGLSMVTYRLFRFRKAQQELAKADIIQQVIEQKVAAGEVLPNTAPVNPAPQPVPQPAPVQA